MDINLNNDDDSKKLNRLVASSLATVMIVLVFAIASVGIYDFPLKEMFIPTEKHEEVYLQSNGFAHGLVRMTRYLNNTRLQNENWFDQRYEEVKSVKYYITNRDEGVNFTNIPDATDDLLELEISKSQLYLHIRFDEEGNSQILRSNGEAVANYYLNNLALYRNSDRDKYANLDFVFIIPEDFAYYNDFFTLDMKQSFLPNYVILIFIIGAVSILILFILALCLPYHSQKRANICRLYNKMFLEIKFLLWLVYVGLFMGILVPLAARNGFNNINGFNIEEVIFNANRFFYLIGIPFTFGLYMLIYLSTVYLKDIYYKGFYEGLLRNSIVGRICIYVYSRGKNFIKALGSIDLDKDEHKKIIAILGVNFIVLWIMATLPGLSILLALVYTVFLFKYLIVQLAKLKQLNEATNQLAKGDFDITLDENMGILSPISKNLNNIKEGFQLAVDQEIKSQKMKAELISNVSHDLKTPLTSIITYVDLLKNQDISTETQKEYIEILDRKSKRLKSLIEDLFEASKASSGNVELQLEKIDVIALFRQTIGELEERIKDSSLQMKMNIPEKKTMCRLDGRRTYRIFENIMSNIFKYALPNSRVYIEVIEEGEEIRFIFKNISAYEMNFDSTEITERFTRGDESRNTEGSGLGLAIAKSFIELQKGRMEVIIDGDLFKLIVIFPKAE